MEHAFAEEISAKLWASFPDEDEPTLAQAIVDAIREPLLVLDGDLRVVTANRSFYLTFDTGPHAIQGMPDLCAWGWRMECPRAAFAAGENCNAACRDGGLRDRAGFFRHRARRNHATERARVFCAGESNASNSAVFRGHHRAARQRARAERGPAAEGRAVAGYAAPCRQQPADHRKHSSHQGADGAIGRDAAAPTRCPSARHVGCRGATAASGLGKWRDGRACPYLSACARRSRPR